MNDRRNSVRHHRGHFLYSVNSYLSYYINERFYKGIHYVWCAPGFDCENNPSSSNPKEIYVAYNSEVENRDSHGAKMRDNKSGLIKGVDAMFAAGVINESEKEDIKLIIEEAGVEYFSPMLYVINKDKVKDKEVHVERKSRASLLSEESLIPNLHSDEFDVICL